MLFASPDPEDYLGGVNTVTFNNGSTSAQLPIPLIDDEGADECDEDFSAQISIPAEAAANAVVAGPDATATVVIKDDERECSNRCMQSILGTSMSECKLYMQHYGYTHFQGCI